MDDLHPNEDRNFDDLAHRFKKNIYGTTKGMLRLTLLDEDLRGYVPCLYDGKSSVRILDAGCGMAQIGCNLAERGHRVHFCDLSKRMLEQAKSLSESMGVSEDCRFSHGPFQEVIKGEDAAYDFIISHAVLEWLAEPEASLSELVSSLAPGGTLSLMFYNANCLVYRNAIYGNFRKVMSGNFRGIKNSFTPLNPLNPEAVTSWIDNLGLTILQKTGIRVFTDYMPKPTLADRSFEDTLAVEKQYCRTEPFASLGRYIHLVCKKEG